LPNTELTSLSLSEASELIAARKLSPLELTQACIARAEALEPQLNTFITRTFDTALVEAKQATADIAAGRLRGPLHGVPFALKDLYETAGVRTTAGSKLRENYVPAEDAETVARLKQAGIVLLGKLNTHEWALGGTNLNVWYGATHNPWGLDQITGGSSGGSGAALAAGLCLGSLGSDTRGSIRLPASFCGVTGLKPTYGRVSLRGIVPLNWSLDHSGPMARTAADCALILQAIAGYDDLDPTSADVPVPDYWAQLGDGVQGLRIGVPRNYFFDPEAIEPEVEQAVREAARAFEALGAKVVDVEAPEPPAADAFLADGGAYHEENVTAHPEAYSELIRTRFQGAAELKAMEYSRSRYRQLELKRAYKRLFREVDLLLTPTALTTAPLIPDRADWATIFPSTLLHNTSPFNTTGSPAISLPCGFSSAGLPIGVQLAGRDWEEALVLRTAHAYQGATDWHKRQPASSLTRSNQMAKD
jgi:aspartyl-tRNA(Asn)/glutamyl-tRNA(Gln) amidotransferase subunit A